MIAVKCQVEAIIDLKRDDCPVTNTFAHNNCTVDRLSIRPDRTLHRVISSSDCDICSDSHQYDFKIKRINDRTAWVESCSCAVCTFFSDLSFLEVLGTMSPKRNILRFKIMTPSKSDFRALKMRLKEAGIEFDVVSVKPQPHLDLTNKEEATLKTALKLGYFENSHRISLTDLSHVVGVSPSSMSEMIRRGMKKVVNYYFDRKS